MGKHYNFIKEAYEGKHGSICQEWKDTILEHYPEFREEEFKVGDWVIGAFKYPPYDPRKITSIKGRIANYNDPEKGDGENNGNRVEHMRKATKEEIEQHLIKEAERRGLWDVPVKCLYHKVCKTNKSCIAFYNHEEDALWSEYGLVYQKGQWAEIIPTMTKEEAEKKLNCKIV